MVIGAIIIFGTYFQNGTRLEIQSITRGQQHAREKTDNKQIRPWDGPGGLQNKFCL